MKDNLWKPSLEQRQRVIDETRNLLNETVNKIKDFIRTIAEVSEYTRAHTSDPRLKKKTSWERLLKNEGKENWDELIVLLGKIIDNKSLPDRDKLDTETINQIRATKELRKWYQEACRLREKLNRFIQYGSESELDYILYRQDEDEKAMNDPFLQFLVNTMGITLHQSKNKRAKELDDFKSKQLVFQKQAYEETDITNITKVVKKILRILPLRQKQAFKLHFFNKLPYEQVGKRMNINPRNACEYAQEAYKKLKNNKSLQDLFHKGL